MESLLDILGQVVALEDDAVTSQTPYLLCSLVKFQQRYVNSHRVFCNCWISNNFLAFGGSQFEGMFSRSILGA